MPCCRSIIDLHCYQSVLTVGYISIILVCKVFCYFLPTADSTIFVDTPIVNKLVASVNINELLTSNVNNPSLPKTWIHKFSYLLGWNIDNHIISIHPNNYTTSSITNDLTFLSVDGANILVAINNYDLVTFY